MKYHGHNDCMLQHYKQIAWVVAHNPKVIDGKMNATDKPTVPFDYIDVTVLTSLLFAAVLLVISL